MKKIVFCRTFDSEYKSWFGTYNRFYEEFKADNIAGGDLYYGIKNYPLHFRLYRKFFDVAGGDCKDIFLYKKLKANFLNSLQKSGYKNQLFFHFSDYCIPKEALEYGEHMIYQDATIYGITNYTDLKIQDFYLKKHERIAKEYYLNAKSILTFNEWTKKSIIDQHGIDSKKVHNIGFGANLKPYHGKKDYENSLILIVLRRGMEYKKGLTLLLEAFKMAKVKNNNIKLAVVGTTSETINGVEYFENFPREKTIELFQQSALYAMPAMYEPNGIVYIEALANKTPILGLDRCAFPEFSGDGKYGYIAKSPDASEIASLILEAIASPRELKEKGEAGQQYVMEKYDWNTVAKKIKTISGIN